MPDFDRGRAASIQKGPEPAELGVSQNGIPRGISRTFCDLILALSTSTDIRTRWTRELIDIARDSQLIRNLAPGGQWGSLCSIRDQQIEEEPEIAVVQPFTLACTALKRAMAVHAPDMYFGEGVVYVHVSWHGGDEFGAMTVRDAVTFLTRTDGDSGRRKRLVSPDATLAMVEVLGDELSVPPGVRWSAVLASARADISEALLEQRPMFLERIARCLDVQGSWTDQQAADALLSWIELAPVFPPRTGSLNDDIAYAILNGLLLRSRGRWGKLTRNWSPYWLERCRQEARRLHNMARRFESIVGAQSERCQALRLLASGLRRLFRHQPSLRHQTANNTCMNRTPTRSNRWAACS